MGISLSEVLKGYIDRGDLNPVTPVGINPEMMKLFGKLYSGDTSTTQGASKKPFFEPPSTRKAGVSGPKVVPL